MKQVRIHLRLLAAFLALVMVIGLMPASALASDGGEITVFVSFEGFNLGHGFYIEPTAIRLAQGSTAMDATSAALNQAGHDYTITAFGSLDRVYGIHPGGPIETPPYITIETESGAEDGSVGSFDYTEYSGWMFTLNHFMAPVGADSIILVSGDVIRWQFSIEGWGADLGLGPDWGAFAPGLFVHEDKTELIRALFAEGANQDAVQGALGVIINPQSTAGEVSSAFAALELPDRETDKSDLTAVLADALTRLREDYVPADAQWDPPFWGIFQTAISAAQVVAANPNASQLAVDGALERLSVALDALVPVEAAEIAPELEFEPEPEPPAVAWANPFADVSSGDWFYDYVQFVYTNGFMNGVTTDLFAPETELTLAMAVTLLWRAAEQPSVADVDIFSDVLPGQWYTNAVAWAFYDNILVSVTDEFLMPGQAISSGHFVQLLSNYKDFVGADNAAEMEHMQTMITPHEVLTRAEAALLIQQFMEFVA